MKSLKALVMMVAIAIFICSPARGEGTSLTNWTNSVAPMCSCLRTEVRGVG